MQKLCNRISKNWRKRELKKVLEKYWSKQTDFNEVKYVGEQLKKDIGLSKEAKIEFISSNDFSYYDNMLDTSILLGAIPKDLKI